MWDALYYVVIVGCICYSLGSALGAIVEHVKNRRRKRVKQKQCSDEEYYLHSSTPWVIEKSSNRSDDAPDFCIVSDGVIIAEVYGYSCPSTYMPSRMNSRLISQAPEMFRILSEAKRTSLVDSEAIDRLIKIVRGSCAETGEVK